MHLFFFRHDRQPQGLQSAQWITTRIGGNQWLSSRPQGRGFEKHRSRPETAGGPAHCAGRPGQPGSTPAHAAAGDAELLQEMGGTVFRPETGECLTL